MVCTVAGLEQKTYGFSPGGLLLPDFCKLLIRLGLAGSTGLEPAASGVTGRRQQQPNAADPGKSGSLSRLMAVRCRTWIVFRNGLQVLASAATFGGDKARTALDPWRSWLRAPATNFSILG
jgi:hypothetical protein